jgi:hypothetical protein
MAVSGSGGGDGNVCMLERRERDGRWERRGGCLKVVGLSCSVEFKWSRKSVMSASETSVSVLALSDATDDAYDDDGVCCTYG